jgi:PKD repeat protein
MAVFICLLLILPVSAAITGKVVISADVVIPAPVAAFSSNVTEGVAPLPVKFTDTSTGFPALWAWEFGDGATSSEQNPVHVYTTAGTYSVTLTVTNGAGSDSLAQTNLITVNVPADKKPKAEFTAQPRTGDPPLTVQFTDLSLNNPTAWEWSFGDGGRSNDRNPSHIYTSPGSYNVKLKASNSKGTDTETKAHYIFIQPGRLHVDFSGTPLSGKSPLTVKFTDVSTGEPRFWLWWFGDDSLSFSLQQNPTHTYRRAGTYTVRLTVFRMSGSDTETKGGYVTVTRW